MEQPKSPNRNVQLSDGYGTKYSGEYVYFGVVYEEMNPPTISEISRDIIGLLAALPPSTRLAVVSPNSRELYARLGTAFDVDFQDGGFNNPRIIWKAYYQKQVPIPPDAVSYKYVRRILPPEARKKITIRPNKPNMPSLERPGDFRTVPPGMSPMTMRPTYRGPAPQGTPQLLMYSSADTAVTSAVSDPGQGMNIATDDYLQASLNKQRKRNSSDGN
jgi:hypothetical protein